MRTIDSDIQTYGHIETDAQNDIHVELISSILKKCFIVSYESMQDVNASFDVRHFVLHAMQVIQSIKE